MFQRLIKFNKINYSFIIEKYCFPCCTCYGIPWKCTVKQINKQFFQIQNIATDLFMVWKNVPKEFLLLVLLPPLNHSQSNKKISAGRYRSRSPFHLKSLPLISVLLDFVKHSNYWKAPQQCNKLSKICMCFSLQIYNGDWPLSSQSLYIHNLSQIFGFIKRLKSFSVMTCWIRNCNNRYLNSFKPKKKTFKFYIFAIKRKWKSFCILIQSFYINYEKLE